MQLQKRKVQKILGLKCLFESIYLACYIYSKRAVYIELKDSNIRLIGKSSKDPKGFISWQIKDKWNQTITTPDKKLLNMDGSNAFHI